jgi:uncharacterized membrane protein
MNCPICGKENPDNAQQCQYCKATLKNLINVRVSRLAIAAIILTFCSLALTIPATIAVTYPRILSPRTVWVAQTFLLSFFLLVVSLILGITSFIRIEKSGGLITGRNFAVGAILLPILGGFFPVWYVIANQPRSRAFRMVCGTNLSGIGKAMILYANDNDDKFPRAGGKETIWANRIPDWKAPNRFAAYGTTPDGSGGVATISSSLYLVVKYMEIEPKKFICPKDPKIKEFNPRKYGVRNKELTELWDFGPEPWKHYSYSYHTPYGDYARTTSSNPNLAVAADRNPWILSPAGQVKDFSLFDPNGDRNHIIAGNSPSHQNDSQFIGSQFVLFVDIHVSMEKTSACGLNNDNIYTSWDGEDIRRGTPPKPGSQPTDKLDSLLLNDPPIKKP